MILADDFDCRSYNSSPVKKRTQQRLSRVRGALNRSCSVPDSNNPPCFLPPTHGDISVPVSNLTEIGAEAPLWCDRPYRLNRGKSCESYPHHDTDDNQMEKSEIFFGGEECEVQDNRTLQDSTCTTVSCQEAEHDSPVHRSLDIPNNHMTKSMLCLNEESQDEVRLCIRFFFFGNCCRQRCLVLECMKSFPRKDVLLPADQKKYLHGTGAVSFSALVWYI